MRLFWLLPLLLAVAPSGCGGLPPLIFSGEETGCPAPFLQGRWQVVHAIEAGYPDGSRGLLVGVTVLSSQDRSLECTLMTVEGLVLLAAVDRGAVEVRRAVPPFDRPGFAAGLIADVRLMLLAPQGAPRAGLSADGRTVCRYRAGDGTTTDMLAAADGWRLRWFDAKGRHRRTATLQAAAAGGPAPRITLQAHGPAPYRLNLTLISAAPAASESGLPEKIR